MMNIANQSQKRRLKELKKELAILKAREDILAFARYINPRYKANWHHRALADKLNAFVRGDVQYLIVSMPPRHGKSELVSRNLPAFIHGIYPDAEIMAASYLDSLAGDMTIAVQKIIDSKEYRDVFPDTKIYPAGTRYVHGTRNSSEHDIVGNKGKYRGQGVGGSFTGKGANFCCVSGTKVRTFSGQVSIENLEIGNQVWSYNHEKNEAQLRRIQAVSRRNVSALVQVKFSSGREIICTPDHPIFTKERGYQEARTLIRGQRTWRLGSSKKNDLYYKMHLLFKRIRAASLRLLETTLARSHRYVLWQYVFSTASCNKTSSAMRTVCQPKRKQNSEILLKMQAETWWNYTQVPVFFNFQRVGNFNKIQRRLQMLCLFFFNKTCSPSYRRKQKERLTGEPYYSLQAVPYVSPQVEGDSVSSVETVSTGEVSVYDIQVEGNHNFFANDILNHNCIIDDPIKGREIADSETYRERLWNFYNNDLFSRLETNLRTGRKGQVLLTMTRWHEDDLAGRLLELMKKDPSSTQWDILNFPAIRTDNEDPLDPRAIGEALWPEKYDIHQLEQIKSSVGPRAWASLYQQTPRPFGGGYFSEQMFDIREIATSFNYTYIMADTAYKDKEENDFTVFTTFGMLGGQIHIIDVFKAKIKAADIEKPAEDFIRKHSKYGFRGAYIEPKGHGIYLNTLFRRKGLMMPSESQVDEFFKDRRLNKVERASNIVPYLTNVKIIINKNILYIDQLINELLGFPRSTHDDFTDTVIDGVKYGYSNKMSTARALLEVYKR